MQNELTKKSLLIYSIIILLFFIILDIIYGLFINYFLNNYKNFEIDFINKIQPKYLILGSSTSKYALNPKYFDESTYNASKNGEGFLYSYLMIKNLNKKYIDKIILSIDPIDLSNDYKDKKNLSNLLKLIFFKNNDYVKKIIFENPNYINYLNYSNLYNFKYFPYFYLDQIRFSNSNSMNGYTELNGSLLQDNQINSNDIDKCEKRKISDTNLNLINEIFEISKENEISLIFHITPMFSESKNLKKIYRSYYDCNKIIIDKLTQKIKNKRECNLMTNYPNQFTDFANNKNYFYDKAHINSRGSVIYSKIFQRWINDIC